MREIGKLMLLFPVSLFNTQLLSDNNVIYFKNLSEEIEQFQFHSTTKKT